VPRKLKKLKVAAFREAARDYFARHRATNNRNFNLAVPAISPSSTGLMHEEEDKILEHLAEAYPYWVNMWKMLNILCGPRDHWRISRPKRMNLLAVLVRIKNERKVVYRDYSVRLSQSEALKRDLFRPGQVDLGVDPRGQALQI
jgi:hypothetical protein